MDPALIPGILIFPAGAFYSGKYHTIDQVQVCACIFLWVTDLKSLALKSSYIESVFSTVCQEAGQGKQSNTIFSQILQTICKHSLSLCWYHTQPNVKLQSLDCMNHQSMHPSAYTVINIYCCTQTKWHISLWKTRPISLTLHHNAYTVLQCLSVLHAIT